MIGSLVQILSHTLITVPTQRTDRVVQANDGSCEISVPASWVDTPELSKEAVLGAKDPRGTEYILVFTESRQDYTGTLAEYVRDVSNRLRDKLTTPQIEAPASITINGRSAIRQVVRGEIDRTRITYHTTYFEGQNRFYRVFCWSLESKATNAKGDFDKIVESFREKTETKGGHS